VTKKRALEIATAAKMEGLVARFEQFRGLDEARVDDGLHGHRRRKINLIEWAPEVCQTTGTPGLASDPKGKLTINGAAAVWNLWNCPRN